MRDSPRTISAAEGGSSEGRSSSRDITASRRPETAAAALQAPPEETPPTAPTRQTAGRWASLRRVARDLTGRDAPRGAPAEHNATEAAKKSLSERNAAKHTHHRRVDSIEEPSEDNPHSNRATAGKVRHAALAGRREEVRFKREGPHGGKEIIIDLTDGLRPDGTMVHQHVDEKEQPEPQPSPEPEPAPTPPPEEGVIRRRRVINPEAAPTEPTSTPESATGKQWHWARIYRMVSPADAEKNADAEFHLERVVSNLNSETDFEIVIRADGLTAEERAAELRRVNEKHIDADGTATYDQQNRAALLKHPQTYLKEAPMKVAVLVGAPTKEELLEVVSATAGNGLPSSEKIAWQSDYETYTSEEAAWAATNSLDPDGIHDIASAEEVASYTALPGHEELHGVGLTKRFRFSTNFERIAPEDVTITLGDILDNNGNVIGKEELDEYTELRGQGIIGAIGSGKTNDIRGRIVESMVAAERMNNDPTRPQDTGRPTIVVDAEKPDNFTDSVADLLRAKGLPEEYCKVVRIAWGEDGVRVNINLMRQAGLKPKEIIAQAITQLASTITDPETNRIFKKYGTAALELAYSRIGYDMDSGEQTYPHGTPPQVDMNMLRSCLVEVIESTSYKDETKQELNAFNLGTLDAALRGIPGEVFKDGFDIDWDAVLQSKGVIAIQLNTIKDPAVKQMAMAAIFNGWSNALKRLGTDINHVRSRLFMDEARTLLRSGSEIADTIPQEVTVLRGFGGAFTWSITGEVDSIPLSIWNNTIGKITVFGISGQADVNTIADRFGISRDDAMAFLSKAKNGAHLTSGLSAPNGPVRGRTHNWEAERPYDPESAAYVRSAEHLLDTWPYEKAYPIDVFLRSRAMLLKHSIGVQVRTWAELNVISLLSGHAPIALNETPGLNVLRRAIDNMGDENPELRDCMITMAVKAAVDARPIIMKIIDPRAVTDHVKNLMLGNARNIISADDMVIESDLNLKFVFAEGKFSPIIDDLVEKLDADSHPETGRFEAVLGKIGGTHAPQQVAFLHGLEGKALLEIGDYCNMVGKLTEVDLDDGAEVLGNILGGTPVSQPNSNTAVAPVDIEMLTNLAVSKLEQASGTPLTDAQKDAIMKMVQRIRQLPTTGHESEAQQQQELQKVSDLCRSSSELTEADIEDAVTILASTLSGTPLHQAVTVDDLEGLAITAIRKLELATHVELQDEEKKIVLAMITRIKHLPPAGYGAAADEINAYAKQHAAAAPGIELGQWQEAYRKDDLSGLVGLTALEQYEKIKEMQASHTEAQLTDPLIDSDLYFTHNVLGGTGLTMDEIVTYWTRKAMSQGIIHESLRKRYENAGEEGRYGIVRLTFEGTGAAKLWGHTASERVTFSPSFYMTHGTRSAISGGLIDSVTTLGVDADSMRKRGKQIARNTNAAGYGGDKKGNGN